MFITDQNGVDKTVNKNNYEAHFFTFCDTRNGETTIHSWDLIKTTESQKNICLLILKRE